MPKLLNLLLVDDEVEIRQGMGRFFPWEDLGFRLVAACENGKQAFDYVVRNPVDVVLCDIRMPVLDGLAFAKMVREAGVPLMLVFFSAHRDFEYARKAMEYRVRHFVLKSMKYEHMIRLFREIRDELSAEGPSQVPAPSTGEDQHARLVSAVTAYVKQHLAENPNLENMARQVGLSPDHLGKVFKATIGQNFSDFLMAERMEKAAGQLARTNLKTYEIGASVGYYNAKNFTRAFKAYHGVSPREYRHPGSPAPGEGEGEGE